jgi:DHA1 family tetracycline resistance protein-like MFS transporter
MNIFNIEKRKLIIIITVLIDTIGVGIVIPVLPFYIQHLNIEPEWVIRLFMIFAICSFFSTPFLGNLSDRIGRRPVLLASIFSTALGWIIFALANNIWFLIIGRIIDGLAAGNFTTAQSYLVDISTDKKDRTQNLGIIGALFGLGFLIGPALGGLLGEIHPSLPFWIVGIISTINFILAYFFLPETNHNRTTSDVSLNPFAPMTKAFVNKKIIPLYFSWLMFAIAVSIQQSISALYLNKMFGFTASLIGVLMAGQGLVIIINQAWAIKKIWLVKFDEAKLTIMSSLSITIGFLLLIFPNFIIYIIGILFTSLSHSIYRTTATSEVVGLAEPTQKGEVLGIMSSIMSFGMIIGPIISELVYRKVIYGPYFVGAIILALGFTVLYYDRNKLLKHTKTIEEVNVI